MKNMKKNFFSIALMACLTVSAYAQQSRVAQQRIILDEAISTIEDYETCATVSDDEIYYSFLDLFVNEKAPVYNDLLGDSKSKTVTAGDYARRMYRGMRNKKATIYNVKNEGVTNENGVWRARFSFEKSVSYVDSCGIYFSSQEFYDQVYHLTANMVYDESSGRCKIESITGTIDSQKSLPTEYFVFVSEDPRDEQLLYHGEPVAEKLNSYHQAFLPGSVSTVTKKDFSFPDPSIEPRLVADRCNVSMSYRIRRLRLKAHYDLGLGKAYQLDGDNLLKSSDSKASSFGLDFGYMFSSKSSFSLGAFIGVGMTQSTIDLAYENPDYQFTSTADVDGDTYTRHYRNLALKQSMKLSELNVPLYMDMNYSFNPYFSVFADLGVRLNFDMKHEVDATEGSAYVYGVYHQYDGLVLDEQWGYNGFGQQTYGPSQLLSKELLDVNSFTVDGVGSLGFRFNIPTTPLTFELGLSYLMGLTEVVKTANVTQLTTDGNLPVVYNTVSGMESTEHLHNLSESLNSIKRQQLRLNLGLTLKF